MHRLTHFNPAAARRQHGISLIDRGYADFRGKLEALGADFD